MNEDQTLENTPLLNAEAQSGTPHRAIRGVPFVWISKAAMDRCIEKGSHTTLAVYMALARMESDLQAQNKSTLYSSAESIGDIVGLSRECVKEHLKKLKALGLLKINSGRGKKFKGGYASNCYTLLETATSKGGLRQHDVASSLRQHDVASNKETLSEGKRVSLKRNGSACAPPADAGSAASLNKKELKEMQARTYRLQLAMNPPTPKAYPGSCVGGF